MYDLVQTFKLVTQFHLVLVSAVLTVLASPLQQLLSRIFCLLVVFLPVCLFQSFIFPSMKRTLSRYLFLAFIFSPRNTYNKLRWAILAIRASGYGSIFPYLVIFYRKEIQKYVNGVPGNFFPRNSDVDLLTDWQPCGHCKAWCIWLISRGDASTLAPPHSPWMVGALVL